MPSLCRIKSALPTTAIITTMTIPEPLGEALLSEKKALKENRSPNVRQGATKGDLFCL